MDIQRPDITPRLETGIAGLLYLGTIVAGMTSMLGGSAMMVLDDAAATVGHIFAAEPLYRLGIATEFLGGVLYIGVTVILSSLLKPANRTASLAAVAWSAAGCAAGGGTLTVLLAPTGPVDYPASFVGFAPGELQAIALVAIRLHAQVCAIGMLAFGVFCATLGRLTFGSIHGRGRVLAVQGV